jgi:hypothetical protein
MGMRGARARVRSRRVAIGRRGPIFLCIVLLVGLLQSDRATALSTWTQSSWSGGVGTNAGNQYASAAGVDVSNGDVRLTADRSNWFDKEWRYRRQITFNNTSANLGTTPQALDNFPVLVKLTSSNFDFAKAQSAGQDIRFTDSDGTTLLNYDIDTWDAVAQLATIWVEVPQIATGNTDSIYAYYGNATATDAQSPASTWDSGFSAVWHMNEASGSSVVDTTTHANTGTANGTTVVSGGPFGIARNFPGTSNYVTTPLVNGSTVTVSAWATVTAPATAGSRMLWNKGFGGPDLFLSGGWLSLNTWDSNANAFCFAPSGLDDGNYHNITMVDAPSGATLYIDGSVCGTAQYRDPTGAFNIGSGAGYDWDGNITEMRVSPAARSAAYVAADYSTGAGHFNTYGGEETRHTSESGNLTSAIYDTGVYSDWSVLNYSASVPSGSSLVVRVRSGDQPDLSDASAFTTCANRTNGSDLSGGCTPDHNRYVQYQLALADVYDTESPQVNSVSIQYSPSDVTPPSNAGDLVLKRTLSSNPLSPNSWVNVAPYISWTPGQDEAGGSGVKGYCLYVGEDPTANPVTTKGLLGSSPISTDGYCQYITASTSIALSTAGVLATPLTSSTNSYYLLIRTVDEVGNISAATASIDFRFDNDVPTLPSYFSAPSTFVSSKDVHINWPTNVGNSATDATSGLVGLQYRIGLNGTWYGDAHNGHQDLSDVLANDGDYETSAAFDYSALQEGSNVVYFRSLDAAGNVSAALGSVVVKLNTQAPSAPQNVTATPSTNTGNSFAFSWSAPASFQGAASALTYCYSINALPTASNCTFTPVGATSLPADAYATQPGDNTLYVVAKDEAGNILYGSYGTATFTANTPAPGVPLQVDVSDVSDKATSNWRLALSWYAPSNAGAGVAQYKVLRSTDGVNYTQIGTTSGISYVDSGLGQNTYSYKVIACDSANNCGASSVPVTKLPTGHFTSPANIITDPTVQVSTRSASISWTTDRISDSRIQYGLSSGNYFATESSNSDQVVNHNLSLANLAPGTKYFYRVLWTDVDGNIGTSVESSFLTAPAPTVSNVSVTGTSISGATINFTVTHATKVKLYYGPSEGYGATAMLNTSTDTSSYSFPLSNLTDGTTYFYKLNTFDTDGNEYDNPTSLSFETLPRPHISNLQFASDPSGSSNNEVVTWVTNVPATSEVSYQVPGGPQSNSIDTGLKTQHSVTLVGLTDDTAYELVARSRDGLGNLAISDMQVFHTALDTTPPVITNVNATTQVLGTGADAHGEVVVSWTTDEPSTSQVAYGQGSEGPTDSTTSESTMLTTYHSVVVSILATSSIYHFVPISADASRNTGRGATVSTIVPKGTDSVFAVVLSAVKNIFGFL